MSRPPNITEPLDGMPSPEIYPSSVDLLLRQLVPSSADDLSLRRA